MIVVKYEEVTLNPSTNTYRYELLGSESHQDIEEVLLPSKSTRSPIFFTKKFAGRDEYRWQVHDVALVPTTTPSAPVTFRVRLLKRAQVDKQHYLKNIIAAQRKGARSALHPWVIVEVELGHALSVGKANGDIRGNKRYVETVQLYSMPKRRLAIVTQVLERQPEILVQVIPISSKEPAVSDKTCVRVTSQLTNMSHYQEESWAVCQMIQTVTASRVIAPLVQYRPRVEERDTAFRTKVRGAVRDQLKDALMFGIAAENRVNDTLALAAEKVKTEDLAARVAELESKMTLFKLYEKAALDTGLTVEELREYFQDEAPQAA